MYRFTKININYIIYIYKYFIHSVYKKNEIQSNFNFKTFSGRPVA